MTREEENREKEITQAAESEYFVTKAEEFAWIHGAEWADEHPREGLWDAEKVCDFIKNSCIFSASNSPVIVEFDGDELVRKLRKAMED